MNWLRVHIDLEQIDPSPVERALVKLGAVSIEFSDAADNPILEPAPGETPLWPMLRISALFDFVPFFQPGFNGRNHFFR